MITVREERYTPAPKAKGMGTGVSFGDIAVAVVEPGWIEDVRIFVCCGIIVDGPSGVFEY